MPTSCTSTAFPHLDYIRSNNERCHDSRVFCIGFLLICLSISINCKFVNSTSGWGGHFFQHLEVSDCDSVMRPFDYCSRAQHRVSNCVWMIIIAKKTNGGQTNRSAPLHQRHHRPMTHTTHTHRHYKSSQVERSKIRHRPLSLFVFCAAK